jgi:hypothetical protein
VTGLAAALDGELFMGLWELSDENLQEQMSGKLMQSKEEYQMCFDILLLRGHERLVDKTAELVNETKGLAKTTWWVAFATWVVAGVTIITIWAKH